MGPPRGWCILWFTTLLCMATLPRTASQGSCVRAGFTACCDPSGPINCSISSGNSSCYCDQECYSLNDCCFDIQDVPCFPVDRPLTLLNVIGDPVNNTDVITECTAQFSPGVPLEAVRIRWYSGDGNEIISNLPRVQVGSVEQLNVSHFIRRISLTPVILEDSDNYTCVAYAEGDLLFSSNSSATAEFIVELPAIIVVPPTNTIANISATFTCEVAGVPLPTISWTLPNGNQITSQAMRSNDSSQTFALTEISNESPIIAVSMLNIESVSPGDEGEYTCTAVNTRNSVSETATLTVQVDRPLILLNVVGDPVNNTNVIAECTAQFCPGVPLEAVRIQWYNGDGNEIISNLPRLQVGSVEQLNETHFIRQISLTPVILEDSDNYTCIAYTEGELLFSSNSSAIAEFIVELPAVIVESPMNVIINVTNNATFICEVAGVPLPSISWTLPNGNQIISQVMSSGNDSSQTFALTELSTESPIAAVSVLYIESVSPGDEGEYTCTAINAKNTVSETAILTVQVPPVVLAENRSLLGLERESIAIRFSINSDSPPVQTSDIRWYFIPDEASDDSDFTDITEQRLIGETLLMFSESHLGLTLSGLTQDAAGVYMLVATNPAGMAFDYTNLTIQAVPRFTAISEDQFVTLTAEQPQAPVTFSCSVYAIPRTNTTWTYVTANGEATITGSEAISIEQTINGYVTNSTLSFTVGVEDRGAFVCSAENVHGEIEDSISLVVYVVPDTLTLNGTNGDIPEGAEIQLQCSISEGWPRPTLMWMRNDVELLNSSRLQIENSTYQTDNGLYRATSVLTISSSLPSDTGVYYCLSEVAIPEVALPPVSINITVTMAAPSTIEIPPQSITVNETDTATFTCSVAGVPLPSITWTLPNGSNLESLAFNQQDVADEQTGVYAETIISNETPYAATSMLNIAPVSRGDAGEYICTAINRLANASSTAILTVQVPPVVLAENRILLGLEQETLIIRFSIVDAAPPVQPSDISWYFIPDGANASNAIDITEQTAIGGTALTFSNSRLELTISSITQEATGIYRLVATTPAGTGSNSTDLEMVQAAPRFAFPPENQFIILTTDQPQDTVIFSCSAYAIPVINITWTYITFDGIAMILSNSSERINIEQEREGYITSSVLMLSDATFADRGVFMCDAGNIHGDIFANASLTVYVVPDMLTLNGTAGEIIERAEIQLQCSLSQGWPRPMLVWLRDNTELSNSSQLQIDADISITATGLYLASSILYIPSSLPGDSGTYTCRPGIDIPDTTITPMSVFINVIMRESATITDVPQSITINETDSATFTCNVTGVPLPSITWTLPDRRNITAPDQQPEELPQIYSQTVTSEETPYAAMSILYIDSATRSDGGVYTCTAMNDDSINSSFAILTVQVPPVVLTSNRALLGLEQESITIRFSIIDASPLVQLSNIHWFFIAGVGGSEMDITEEDMLGETALTFSDSRLELSLSGVTQDAAGIYRLVATNPAGITSNYTNITIQAAPRSIQRPENQQIILSTASPLGSLTLMCNVYAIPEATITWMHIPSSGEATVLTDSLERIGIEQNQEGYTTFSTLIFVNVTFTDRGEFRCTAENEHNTISSNASLVVYVIPELTLDGTAGDNIEETEIQLQCSLSEGWPRPMLVWLRDDVEFATSSRLQIDSNVYTTEAGLYGASSNLTIPSSVPDDSGRYFCRADIDIPDTIVPPMNVSITVASREPATIIVPPQNITVNESDPVMFICSVRGVPLPSITWTLPDGRVVMAVDGQSEESPRIYAETFVSTETPYEATTTLYIGPTVHEDTGEYTCIAINPVSTSSSTTAILTVQVLPVVQAENPSLLSLEGESVTIRFSIEAFPLVQLSDIQWSFIADVPEIDITEAEMLGETTLTFSESRLELTLSGLTQDAAGIYRLVATNPAGVASNCVNLTIQAAPRFVQRPEDQRTILSTASPLGSLILMCNVYAIPEATITWMHIPSNGEATVLTDSLERIDIEQNQEGYTTFSTLTFANVTFTDRGEFRCTAENEHSLINSIASLVVYVVPELTLTGTAGDIIEETEIQLECSLSDAWPLPKLVLSKDDTILVNSTSRLQIDSNIFMTEAGLYRVSSSLTINSSTPEDSGQYSCRADIQVPDTAIPSKSVFITVTRRAPATIVLPPQSITVNATDQATFTCGVAGVPLPSIIWTLPDGSNPESLERQSDELPRIYTETNISDETIYAASSILYIGFVSRVDEGDYTCTAMNDQATVKNSAFLTVQVPPNVLAGNRSLLALEQESVTICFSIENASPEVEVLNIRWFFTLDGTSDTDSMDITDEAIIGDTTLTFSDSRLELSLRGLTQDAAGIYRLVATNPAGIAFDFTNLTIQAIPRFVTPPQNQFVIINPGHPQGSIMLSCSVYAIPFANITWMYTQDNGETITLNNSIPRFNIDESSEGYTTTSTITFIEIVFGDSGSFECQAENVHAVSTSTASLTVYVVPDALTVNGSAGEITEGDRIEIQCTVPPVFPRPTLVWLRDTTVLFSSSRIQLVTVVNQTPEGLFIASSSLTLPTSIPDDSGQYICRADVTVPRTTIPPVDVTVIVTARDECASNPCANGVCIDSVDSYFCTCNEGFIGTNCDEPATAPTAPVIRQPPVNTTVRLGEMVNLTCISEGIPAPTFTWFRDGVELQDETLPYILLISALPNNRGYYICTVSNSEGTVSSLPALLSMRGVRQFVAVFKIEPPDDIVKRQSGNENLDTLVDQLRGRSIGDTGITIYDATVQSYNPDTNEASLLLTLSTGSDSDSFPSGLNGSLQIELSEAGQNIGIEIQPMIPRFDGCPDEEAATYSWPETDLGMVAMVSCTCGNIDTAEISQVAIRVCGGSFAEGAVWVEPDISDCQFSDASRLLCDVSTLNGAEAITQVSVITAVTTELGSVDVSIAVQIITRPDVIAIAATNPDVQDAFLGSIDQLIQGGDEVILQSQQDSGASRELLEGIETFTETVVLAVGETERTLAAGTFVLHVQETPMDDYTGLTFGLDIDINTQAGFDDDSVSSTSVVEAPSTTSLAAPDTILEDAGITSGQNARLAYNVFANATLFQPRPEFQTASGLENFTVGSAIQSLVVAGSGNTRLQLSNPVRMRFQKTKEVMENGTNAMCVFWDPALDDGFGGFSTDGCRMVSDERESTVCECDHLTSFSILLDVAPRPQANLGVEVISYIGLGVSIISLIITIITYLFSRKLRSTANGQLLVNLSLALLGLFVVFIISAQGQKGLTTAGCGFFAAVIHYFLLAYFFFTAAEALFLYYKLVKVFMDRSFFIRNYIYIAMLVAWVTPLIIVAISLAGYQYYGSSTGGDDSDDEVNFCRPYEWPFYFGFIAPFAAIYIFNWIMFILIVYSLCHNAEKSGNADKINVKRQLFIAMMLSVLFGLGWAFGLIGSSSLPSGVSITGQYIFSIFIGFQGVMIFFLYAVRSTDAREEWKRWWYRITCRAEHYRIYGTASRGKTGTLPTQAPSHSTGPSDSFQMGSFSEATIARDDTLKKPLTSKDEKKPHNVPLQETTLALNLVVENPLAKVKEEEARMEEEDSSTGSPSPTDAVVVTLSNEAAEDTITKL